VTTLIVIIAGYGIATLLSRSGLASATRALSSRGRGAGAA
jgi:hypothetical protein